MFRLKEKADPENSSRDIRLILGDISLPPLILDPIWLELFPKDYKNNKMLQLEEKIKGLMKEEARLRERLKGISQLKRRDMNRIMELTKAAYEKNDGRAKNEMNTKRRSILQANRANVLLEAKIAGIADEINKRNTELLTETVIIAYDIMRDSKDKVDALTPEIDDLRQRLFELIEERVDNEEYYNKTYKLLHRLVGKDIINLLDMGRIAAEEDTVKHRRGRWWL